MGLPDRFPFLAARTLPVIGFERHVYGAMADVHDSPGILDRLLAEPAMDYPQFVLGKFTVGPVRARPTARLSRIPASRTGDRTDQPTNQLTGHRCLRSGRDDRSRTRIGPMASATTRTDTRRAGVGQRGGMSGPALASQVGPDTSTDGPLKLLTSSDEFFMFSTRERLHIGETVF